MNQALLLAAASVALHVSVQMALVVRVLLRPHRESASRIAWVLVILAMPVVGILAYLLLGEVSLGRAWVARMRAVMAGLSRMGGAPGVDAAAPEPDIPECHRHLFRVGRSISGFAPVGANSARLMASSDATIDAMVADIDAARDHVHLLFYIWLPDNNGSKIASALQRAAARGVAARAMADDLGSRALIRSERWQTMAASGVKLARALPIGNLMLRVIKGRVDLRNHRKIVVIDNRITYCGSQNCADPAFTVKAKYAPWVDAVIRFEGPIARQNQYLFAADWTTHTGEDLRELLRAPLAAYPAGFAAQAIGTGPTVRFSAMPEMFESLIYSARRELVVTTPYYVPNDSMQAALCASARRGVATTIVFPARNDSRFVAAASRSYYEELLAAGVRIYEYPDGLLHAKSLTVDGEITLIGSANMDRRSFDLNYENNILFYDPALTGDVRSRQDSYIAASLPIAPESVAAWGWRRRFWNNAAAMLGPVL